MSKRKEGTQIIAKPVPKAGREIFIAIYRFYTNNFFIAYVSTFKFFNVLCAVPMKAGTRSKKTLPE